GLGRRDPALVAHARRLAVEALHVDRDHAHVEALGELAQVLHARIRALGVDVDLAHRLRPLPQPAGHRMEPRQLLHLYRSSFFIFLSMSRGLAGSGTRFCFSIFVPDSVFSSSSTKSIFACSRFTRTTRTITRPPSW